MAFEKSVVNGRFRLVKATIVRIEGSFSTHTALMEVLRGLISLKDCCRDLIMDLSSYVIVDWASRCRVFFLVAISLNWGKLYRWNFS